jgi:hypothetical protein
MPTLHRIRPDDLRVGARYLHSNGSFIRTIDSIDGDTVRWHDQHGPGICSRKAFLRVCSTPALEPSSSEAKPVHPSTGQLPSALSDFSLRDEANALTAYAFRNGFLEDLHAGNDSPLLAEPSLSRISDEEMRRLMIEASEKLAEMLRMKLEDPAAYAAWLRSYHWRFCRRWKRD